jgi:hypothetical protein
MEEENRDLLADLEVRYKSFQGKKGAKDTRICGTF